MSLCAETFFKRSTRSSAGSVFWFVASSNGAISPLLRTCDNRFSILLPTSIAPWLSHLTGSLRAFLNQIKLLNYFCQPALGVNNQGIGDAGIIRVSADSISLDNESAITASTTFGERGNIQLKGV